MKLNDLDARAVDTVLNGRSSSAGDDTRQTTGTSGAGPIGFSPTTTGHASAMNDDLANRITTVDSLLKLLDYLPAEEPPANLVSRTMRRLEDARRHRNDNVGAAARAAYSAGSTGVGQGVRHSPNAGGDEDPAST